MMVELDSGAIVTAILGGLGAHAAVVKWAISSSVAKLGREIAEEYVTKDDLRSHVEDMH